MNTSFTFLKKTSVFFVLLVAVLFVNTSKAELTFDPSALDFGPVAQGTQLCRTVVVTNTAHSAVTITGWSLHNQSSECSLTPVFSQSIQLQQGESVSLQICYTPDGLLASFQNTLVVLYTSAGHDTSVHSAHLGFTGSLDHHNNTDTTHHDSDTTHHHDNDTTHHDPHHCLSVHHGDGSNDPVVIGATAEHTIYLINPTNFDITVASAVISGAQASIFTITSTFPLVVPANTSNTALTYNFTPDGSGHNGFSADLTLTLSGDSLVCQTVNGNVIGYPVLQHDPSGHNTDTVVHPLFPSEHRTLGIEGNGNHTSMTFYFTNNLNVDATVNNVYLDDMTYFTIASMSPSPVPFVLHPGDRLTVTVTYTATDQHVHYAHLMVDADHQLQSTSFDLQGVQLQAASVSNLLPSGVSIFVSPNPAKDFVTVDMSGVRTADIQVTDMLGKTLISSKSSSTWKWDASSIPNGSYVVRISGESSNGNQFTASKRIVISK